jgi:hypothetical protein
MQAKSLKPRLADALVALWQDQGNGVGAQTDARSPGKRAP